MQFLENPIVVTVIEMFIQTLSQMFSEKDIYHVVQFSDELRLFSELCFEGELYRYINKKLGTDDAKSLMMFVCFSDSKNDSDEKEKLKNLFPNIVAFMDAFKALHGAKYVLERRKMKGEEKYDKPYAVFPVSLQQIESILFIDTLYPAVSDAGFKCLPKHDSLIVDEDKKEEVLKIIQNIMNGISFKYHLKINGKNDKNADLQKKIVPESIQHSTAKISPVKSHEKEETTQRFLTVKA